MEYEEYGSYFWKELAGYGEKMDHGLKSSEILEKRFLKLAADSIRSINTQKDSNDVRYARNL